MRGSYRRRGVKNERIGRRDVVAGYATQAACTGIKLCVAHPVITVIKGNRRSMNRSSNERGVRIRHILELDAVDLGSTYVGDRRRVVDVRAFVELGRVRSDVVG